MGLECCTTGGGSDTFSGAEAFIGGITVNSSSPSAPLSFSIVNRDTDDYFDLSSDSFVATAPFDGVYLIGVYLDWSEDSARAAGDACIAEPTINGSTSTRLDARPLVPLSLGGHTGQCITYEERLSAGDEIGCDIDLRSGSTSFTCTLNGGMWLEFRGNDSP